MYIDYIKVYTRHKVRVCAKEMRTSTTTTCAVLTSILVILIQRDLDYPSLEDIMEAVPFDLSLLLNSVLSSGINPACPCLSAIPTIQ
jgi:hypothetical protein